MRGSSPESHPHLGSAQAKPRGTLFAYAATMVVQSSLPCTFLNKACRPIAIALGLAVVLGSQWAMGAGSTAQLSSDATANTTTARTVPSAPEPSASVPPDRYHLAFGTRVSAGSANFDTELATMVDGYLRYQWNYGLGLAASYLQLDVGNNESYESFKAKALTLGPTWHPLEGFWFDPFVEAHLVGIVGIHGGQRFGYADASGTFHEQVPSRIGVEGILGLQFASRYVAGGLHARFGSTDHHWSMLGVQVEARL